MEAEPVFETINQSGTRLMVGFHEILDRFGVPHTITGVPALFGVIVGATAKDTPRDYRTAVKYSDDALSSAITASLRGRGVLPDPEYAEPWFLCYALSETDVDETLDIYENVVREVTR
jgi:glutamate-1-semialdehyde aminotransferase